MLEYIFIHSFNICQIVFQEILINKTAKCLNFIVNEEKHLYKNMYKYIQEMAQCITAHL